MTNPGPTLTLAEVAERLGVHYMTAYKHVRSGRLPASKVGQEWLIKGSDLAAFERRQQRPLATGSRRAAYPAELQDRLLHADEVGGSRSTRGWGRRRRVWPSPQRESSQSPNDAEQPGCPTCPEELHGL